MTRRLTPAEFVQNVLDREIANGKLWFAFPAHELSPNDPIVLEVAMRIGDDCFSEGIKEIHMMDLRNKDLNEFVKSSVMYNALSSRKIHIPLRPRWFLARL